MKKILLKHITGSGQPVPSLFYFPEDDTDIANGSFVSSQILPSARTG